MSLGYFMSRRAIQSALADSAITRSSWTSFPVVSEYVCREGMLVMADFGALTEKRRKSLLSERLLFCNVG